MVVDALDRSSSSRRAIVAVEGEIEDRSSVFGSTSSPQPRAMRSTSSWITRRSARRRRWPRPSIRRFGSYKVHAERRACWPMPGLWSMRALLGRPGMCSRQSCRQDHGGVADSDHRHRPGPQCDGQVLVIHDMLGLLGEFQPRFARRYAELGEAIRTAAAAYIRDVRNGLISR